MQDLPHDKLLDQLMTLRGGAPYPLKTAADHFVQGIGGTWPRGRSVLLDFLTLSRFEPHTFQGLHHCEICGLPASANLRPESALQSAHAGHSSNEVIENVLPRWQETIALPTPNPTPKDAGVLRDLLHLISDTTEDETPGLLEKRIAKARILPKTDKYKRHGILQTLAECGILPNDLVAPMYDGPRTRKQYWDAHSQLTGSPRSDIVLPLAGWRGRMGVNMDRYREIFGA